VTAILGEQNLEAPTGSLGADSKNVFQFTMKYRGRLKSVEEFQNTVSPTEPIRIVPSIPVSARYAYYKYLPTPSRHRLPLYEFTMKYRGRLKSVEEFQNTVLRAEDDGSTLRLKDVAKVELGALSYSFHGKTNGHPGVTFMAFQVAGANATSVNEAITDKLNEMSKDLPAGTEFLSMMSSNDFLFASIHNVVETLVIAIILVILRCVAGIKLCLHCLYHYNSVINYRTDGKHQSEKRKNVDTESGCRQTGSSNDFLFASIHNVVETLVIAIILVILVVYFFLQDFKSTLIPSISIIVSLVGTFACLTAAGFSINILTLFALVLAIGTVVMTLL